MARNGDNGSRRTANAAPAPTRQPRRRRDRRQLMIQLTAAFLVLAMLLPVLIVFL